MKKASSAILITTTLVFGASAAHATLDGDDVTCAISPSEIWSCNPPNAVVGPGPEFDLELDNRPFFRVDISSSTVRLDYVAEGGLSAGAGEIVTFGDLQWTDFPSGRIIGIENFATGDTTGVEAGDITFSDDSTSLDFDRTTWSGVGAFVQWDLVVEHNTPPVASCEESVNPSGKRIPPAGSSTLPGPKGGQNEDGFYALIGEDAEDGTALVFVTNASGSATFGPFSSGSVVKITEARGATPTAKEMGGPNSAVAAHITLDSDAFVFAVDSFGEESPVVSCLVPPPPK
jgi:hypothetical protein